MLTPLTPSAPTEVPASRAELLRAVHVTGDEISRLEARRLVLIASLCDAYADPDDPTAGSSAPLDHVLHGEQIVFPGASRTPGITEFFHLELAIALGCSPESAQVWIADVLNLRHRHPQLWGCAVTGQVPIWSACQVARACLRLDFTQARRFDAEHSLRMPAWTAGRALRTAQEYTATHTTTDQQRECALASREVRFTPSSRNAGLTLLEADLDSGAAAHLDRTLDRVADVLRLGGSTDPHSARRSDALGHLAHPDRARLLLSETLLDGGSVTPEGDVVTSDGEIVTADHERCRHGAQLILHLRPSDLTREGSDVQGPEVTHEPMGLTDDAHRAEPFCDGEPSAPPRDRGDLEGRVMRGGLISTAGELPSTRYRGAAAAWSVPDDQPGLDEHGRRGLGPVLISHLTELLAGCSGRVTIRPVIDLNEPIRIDQYRPGAELSWRVRTRDQQVMFPHSNRSSWSRGTDLDHTQPWPEGLTEQTNLGTLSRTIHRAKTHGGFELDQSEDGTFTWTTPAGQTAWVNAHGTWASPPPAVLSIDPADTTRSLRAHLADATGPAVADQKEPRRGVGPGALARFVARARESATERADDLPPPQAASGSGLVLETPPGHTSSARPGVRHKGGEPPSDSRQGPPLPG